MKTLIAIFCFILFTGATCKPNKSDHPVVDVAVATANNIADGTVTVKCSAVGNNETLAMIEAEKKAFRLLLFYGYPSSTPQISPMVEDEAKTLAANPAFFEQFFDKGGYKTFIIRSNNASVGTSGLKFYLVRELQINVRSLRPYLEQNNIIRKFGF